MDTRIYVMTHKTFTKPDDELYTSLHVGRAISADLTYLGDDTGQSISAKNPNYCELTGIYWLWKNVRCDIVGICHYRRYFVVDEDYIKKDYIEKCLETYDLILPHSCASKHKSLYDHYTNTHYKCDIDLTREVIEDLSPDYLQAFDLCMDCNLESIGNMMICKKEIFDSYCEWLFKILFAVEERCDISSYSQFQARIFGYLSERLLRVWVLRHAYKVKEVEVRLIERDKSLDGSQILALKKGITQLYLNDFTNSFIKSSLEEWQEHLDLSKEDNTVDFHGKIPVFSAWWQGIDDMPDLVETCLKSIDSALPQDLCEFHLITLDNVTNYCLFPDSILEKFKSGHISLTCLSGILRTTLLTKYGGMWIDATYFCAKEFPRKLFADLIESNELKKDYLWTIKNSVPKFRHDVSQGRWAGNILIASKSHPLFRYISNAFFDFFKEHDDIPDYFFIDYIFNNAYDYIGEIKSVIDSVPISNPKVLDLADLLNSKFKAQVWTDLCKDTWLFKLNRRAVLSERNIADQLTFYGYIQSLYKNKEL